MKKSITMSLFVLSFLLFLNGTLKANTIQYVSPKPGSVNNTESTNIIIGFSDRLTEDVINSMEVKVVGSLSGIHIGKLLLVEKNKRVIFKSDNPFASGEKVTVTGAGINDFYFYIRAMKPDFKFNGNGFSINNEIKQIPFNQDYGISPDTLPALTIYNSGNTAIGYVFIANFKSIVNNSTLMMLNNNGTANFERTIQYRAYDFNKQNENLLSYFSEDKRFYLGLDNNYNVVDSFKAGNGFDTDLHELVVNSDGSAWLLIYDPESVDMSIIVPGGKTNAVVTGLIIQKINAQKEVVFQWRSWDHFQITDATHENLTAYSIDYVHGNALQVDNDGNIMLSSRHLDEITKINTTTGDIIWRLGGKNNQFQFLNDTIGFSHQHCIRKLPGGNIILFDNGNYHTPNFSRAVEYTIDEVNKTVNLVWQYRHTPDIYAYAMGSVQRLSNGNTFIGWGSASTTLTEVTPEGTVVYELSLPSGQMSYRAYRYEWGIMSSTTQNENENPSKYVLYQNYPNPFNPATTIKYHIANDQFVILKVFDLLGKEITTLVNKKQSQGTYEMNFDGSNLSSGIYFIRLQTDRFADVKKMVILK